ncbi:MAG: heparinase II/III family protein [Planctomycetota bacterium]|nr:heparinase II/III family protein [Planctomycetota bacterium]
MSETRLPDPYRGLSEAKGTLLKKAIRHAAARRMEDAHKMLHKHFCGSARAVRFYVEESELPDTAAEIRERFPEHVEATMKDAEEAARNRFPGPGTGGQFVDLGTDFDWSLEKSPVPDQEFTARLNRMPYVLSMARAYWYSGKEERYAADAARIIWNFIKRNPPPLPYEKRHVWRPDTWGLLQIALRMHAWIWAHHLLRRTGAWNPVFVSRLLAAIEAHANILSCHLNVPSSNHATMEMRSLLEAGIYFPEFRDAPAWRKVAIDQLQECLRAQVHPDGGQHEGSPGYHCGSIGWFAEPMVLARLNGIRFPASYSLTIEKMCEFAAAVCRPDGTLPPVGDTSIYRPDEAIAIGALATGKLPHGPDGAELARTAGPETLWTFGVSAVRRLARMKPAATKVSSRSFPKTGVYAMASDAGSPPAAWCLVQCREKSWGGHAHADALSFEFAAHGRTVVADSGIFTYHECPDRLRSKETAAHNTVTLDGESQARAAASWRWEGSPCPRKPAWRSGTGSDFFCGEELSWRRLNGAPFHRRAIILRKGGHPWMLLVDWVLGGEEHLAEARFHFDSVEVGKLPAGAVSEDRGRPNVAVVSLDGAAVEIVPGEISHRYDEKHPSRTLVLSRRARAPFSMVSLVVPLKPGDQSDVVSGRLVRISDRAAVIEVRAGGTVEIVTVTPRRAATTERF